MDLNDKTSTNNTVKPLDYIKVLFLCLFLSVFLLCVTRLIEFTSDPVYNSALSVLLSLVPLVYYHLGFLARHSNSGLKQSAVDSVYYYGFLLTLTALGISAVSLMSPSNDLNIEQNLIIPQFGVGLFATGYAVLARMHLSSIVEDDDLKTPEELFDHYALKSGELLNYLDKTVSSFEELKDKSDHAIKLISDMYSTSLKETNSSLNDLIKAAKDDIDSMLLDTKGGISDLKDFVADVSFNSQRKEFSDSLRLINDSVSKLNYNLSELGSVSKETAEKTYSITKAFEGLLNSATVLQSELLKATSLVSTQISVSSISIAQNLKISTEAASLLTEKIVDIATIVINKTNQKN